MKRENQRMLRIKQLVQDDRYEIDPYVVADAILRRVRRGEVGGLPLIPQKLCSKPDSASSESTNANPTSPSVTDPTQVRPAFG